MDSGAGEGAARPTGKRLLIYAYGSRGDVQPQVALALGFKKAGHTVRVVANTNHVDFIRSMGLDAGAAGTDIMEEIRNEPSLKEYIAKGTVTASAKFFKIYMKRLKAVFPETLKMELQEFKDFQPDITFASNLNAYEIGAMASCHNIPMIFLCLVVGWPPSRDVPVMQLKRSSCFPHLALQSLAAKEFLKMEMGAKNAELLLQLPKASDYIAQNFHEAFAIGHSPICPAFCGMSPILSSVPADWPLEVRDHFVLSGFWTLSKEEQEATSKEGNVFFGGDEHTQLEAFLAGGDKPVYIGWGSMMPNTAENMTLFAVRALKISGKRGIILGGYGGLQVECLAGQKDSQELMDYAKEKVLFMKTAPHEYLFPKCCAIVHHGGVGTTAAAVRSGVPGIVTWCAWDQEDNATIVDVKGIGIKMKQFNKNTPESLAKAIKRCTTDETLMSKAKETGERVVAEDGVTPCVAALDKFITEEVDTGKFKASLDELMEHLQEMRKSKKCCWGPRWFCSWYCSSTHNVRRT